MPNDNPYLQEVHANLPRLLALFDRDPFSPTLGVGDRLYWSWKLKDFGNGTFQGAVHGLARLISEQALPEWLSEPSILKRIDAMIMGTKRLTRRDGSLEEAFPYESSFCVTALVAYDLLSCIALLRDRLSTEQKDRWLSVVAPMIAFLKCADETHAIISNHLATAVAGLLRWQELTGEPTDVRAHELLGRILEHASSEGWFKEYDGADPGYQTLAMYYLVDVSALKPEWGLAPVLANACEFLSYCAHPDGSFGGPYGSRDTRFFCPGGIERLAHSVPAAAALALTMRKSIAERKTVTLSAIDESNLVPFFNAYCRAAIELRTEPVNAATLPCATLKSWRHHLPEAGLLIERGSHEYTVVSWHKGGVVCHFAKDGTANINCAPVVRDPRGQLYSAQHPVMDNGIDVQQDTVIVKAQLKPLRHELPTPSRYLILRILNLTVMRMRFAGEIIKQLLVRFLITGQGKTVGSVVRTIHFTPYFAIEDRIEGSAAEWERQQPANPYAVIHMASRGYWQRGDDCT